MNKLGTDQPNQLKLITQQKSLSKESIKSAESFDSESENESRKKG